jgi:hypothetical protein
MDVMNLLRNISDQIRGMIGDDTKCQSLNDFLMLGMKLVDFCEIDDFGVDFSLQERLNIALDLFSYTKIEAIRMGSDKDLIQASLFISRAMKLQGNEQEALNELKGVLDLEELENDLREEISKEIQGFSKKYQITRNLHERYLNCSEFQKKRDEDEFKFIKRRLDYDCYLQKHIKKR